MTTWIGHLRIAEKLLAEMPTLDEVAFTLGNLGPDSGMPNADWTQFDPPKTVTHFQSEGDGEDRIHDLAFYRDYLLPVSPDDHWTYSYRLGYFVHLLSDNLWTRWVWAATQQQFAAEFAEHGHRYVREIKRDWYNLDKKYVRDHPDCLFWRVLMVTPNPPSSLPFLPEAAIHHSLDHIRRFYSTPDPNDILDRVYPLLNERTMARYVDDTVAAVRAILSRLAEHPDLDEQTSALFLLPEADLLPYSPPLGDTP